MSHMFLSIHYPLKNIEILAFISEKGKIFWSLVDICKVVNYAHSSNVLQRYLRKENLMRISNLCINTRSRQYLLTNDQVVKFLLSIPRDAKMFLEFFDNVNNGNQKIYYNEKTTSASLRDKNFLFDVYTTKNNCLNFKTFTENGNEIETTIPEILHYKKLKYSEKLSDKNNASSSSNNNNRMEELKRNNAEDLSFKEGEEIDINNSGCSSSNSNRNATESIFDYRNLIDNSRNIMFYDECSSETYEYLAIDLNWKINDMRPVHIYPFVRFEEDGAFLFVPFKKSL